MQEQKINLCPTLTVEEYMKYAREPKANQVVRLNNDHFQNIEILRVLNSNEFMTPDTARIIGVALEKYVKDSKELNPTKVAVVEKAVQNKLNEVESSSVTTSSIFGDSK